MGGKYIQVRVKTGGVEAHRGEENRNHWTGTNKKGVCVEYAGIIIRLLSLL